MTWQPSRVRRDHRHITRNCLLFIAAILLSCWLWSLAGDIDGGNVNWKEMAREGARRTK